MLCLECRKIKYAVFCFELSFTGLCQAVEIDTGDIEIIFVKRLTSQVRSTLLYLCLILCACPAIRRDLFVNIFPDNCSVS